MITVLNNDTIEVEELLDNDYTAKRCIKTYNVTDIMEVISNRGFRVSNRVQLDMLNKNSIIVVGRYQDFKELIFNTKINYSTNIGYKKHEYN